ncbi:protein IQ-DOMAIN 9 [Arachis hypogaea]|uniref:protein IQ-DOMAIN 9 n=1 Tax=Arachis hypogaea TaxID=3818 RepID=UPI000DED2345|nr:protein IQ-DOMAIN 1 [Arachis hypogaea]
MGSGHWFKTIIRLRKSKQSRSKKSKGSLASLKINNNTERESSGSANGTSTASENLVSSGVPLETIAATRIQMAFRAYKARKSLGRLKGLAKLKILTEGYSVRKQATTAINYLHSWSKIQTDIRARRICMVTEDRIRRKKLDSQLKLEAKLHDLEVDWCGGPETMEEIVARLHQREEAAVKRERAMAYAFSHQWRANCSQSQGLGSYELGKANWGWSWKECWIAARPWESRIPNLTVSPKKAQNKYSSQGRKDKNTLTPNVKGTPPSLGSAKGSTKARRLSYPTTQKMVVHEGKQ